MLQQQGFEITLHRCEWRAQIVRHVGQQFAPHHIGLLEQTQLLRDTFRHFLYSGA